MDIEIPFGAKDSELKGWEYTIPDGMTAEIKYGKIIVKETESEDERIVDGFRILLDGIRRNGGLTLNKIPLDKCYTWLEKQKYDRMKPIYDSRESFESALAKAWNDYHNGYENVDKLEDDYVECAHAKGFREGYLFGIEKQKENPKSADSIPSDCVSNAKCEDRWHKVGDSLPDNPREVLCKDEAGNYFIGRYYVGEGWEISNYDDEDKPHHLNPPVSKWIDFPSEKQKEQKPVEWNEEDRDRVAQYLHDRDGGMLWSKATEITSDILDILHPQPKQEWSEEDERILKGIIGKIDHDQTYGVAKVEMLSFLKSIRPSKR